MITFNKRVVHKEQTDETIIGFWKCHKSKQTKCTMCQCKPIIYIYMYTPLNYYNYNKTFMSSCCFREKSSPDEEGFKNTSDQCSLFFHFHTFNIALVWSSGNVCLRCCSVCVCVCAVTDMLTFLCHNNLSLLITAVNVADFLAEQLDLGLLSIFNSG